MEKEGKILKFPIIHHEHNKDFDPIESRLEHVNDMVSNLPLDDETFLWVVQQKLAETIFWYSEYINVIMSSEDE